MQGKKPRRTRPRPRPATWGRREGRVSREGGAAPTGAAAPHTSRGRAQSRRRPTRAEACEPLQLSRRASGPTGQRAQTLQMGTAAGRGGDCGGGRGEGRRGRL